MFVYAKPAYIRLVDGLAFSVLALDWSRRSDYSSSGIAGSWRFKATCGHVKQSAKALAWRFRAGFFVIARKERGRAEYS
jgi:hypothetical protein